MGWKGLARSYVASKRRELRRQQREFREAQRNARAELQQRRAELEGRLVERYELQLQLLLTVHHECRPTMDWDRISRLPDPAPVPPVSRRTAAAESALAAYSPGFFARLFGGGVRKRAALEAALTEARQKDANENEAALRDHEKACKELDESRTLARAILKGDTSRYVDALSGCDTFDELEEVALKVTPTPWAVDVVAVDIELPTAAVVVPDEQHSLTSRGKLSTKNMPKTRANEIYQDYVCGAAMRTAREVLATLPISWVCVSVYTELLDAATGHTRCTPVLSVIAPRVTIETLHYEALDPSEGMTNFLHRMGFKKSTGMKAIEPFVAADIPKAA